MRRLQNALKQKLLMLLVVVSPLSVYGQGDEVAPVTNTYAITNVNITQAPGRKIEMGTVVIKNGLIQAVGKSVSIPADAKIIEADSMYLYAGFIDGMSHIGVDKPEEKDEDVKDPGNPPNDVAGIQPDRNVRSVLKPGDKSIGDLRQIGFTAAHVVPQGGMLPGSGAIVLLTGDSPDDMIYKNEVSLFSQLAGAPGVYPNTVIGVMAKYRELYRQANYSKNYSLRYEQGASGMERPRSNSVLEAFYPVIDKEVPVAFKAEEVLDIYRVLTLKNDLGFDLILGEVKQGWDVTSQVKSTGVKVFLSLDLPEMEKVKEADIDSTKTEEKENTPESKEEEQLQKRKKEMILKYYQQPIVFRNEGITYGFSTLEVKSKDIRTNLNELVKQGLPEEAALAALTTSPAQLLGLSGTMGTVDNGKIANLVISDQPYFEEKSVVRYVFVDGKLYEYKDKPKKKKSDDEDVNPVGNWTYTTETPQGTGNGTLKIEGEPGDLSGELTSTFSSEINQLTNVEIDGDELTFSFVINVGGQSMTVEVIVTIDGDTFEGTMTAGQFGTFPIEGERSPEN